MTPKEKVRFKKPKNSPFYVHCYQCKHYVFEKQVGCAYIGRCEAIRTDVTETDAYGPPCGLFELKSKRKKGQENGRPDESKGHSG